MTRFPFEQWLEQNRPKLIEWYCEGTMVDKDFLTRIEEFAKEAWGEGYTKGYDYGIEVGYDIGHSVAGGY